ncbi:hypothetical protein Aduo_002784 [Ancylostoma duodenale]
MVDKSTSTQMETEGNRRDDIDPGSDEMSLTKNVDAKSPAEKEEEAPAAPSPATSPSMEPLKPTRRHLYESSDIYSKSHLYDRSPNSVNLTDLQGSSSASTIALHVQVQLLRLNNPNEVFVVPYLKTRESLNIRLRRWFADESKSRIFLRIRSPDIVHQGLPVMVMSHNYCRRAVVQEVNVQTGGVTIWLVDFGEKRTNVKLSSLLFMPRVFAEIPAQVMKFSLGASHYNDSNESISRMQDIAKHFTYSYMQVNCDHKYVDFILRDKGYGQSSSLRHHLVALYLASFDDISQVCLFLHVFVLI